jgi:hypothetical protein
MAFYPILHCLFMADLYGQNIIFAEIKRYFNVTGRK